eukprot:7242766-Lingulodinium_polyedra.AAC.1
MRVKSGVCDHYSAPCFLRNEASRPTLAYNNRQCPDALKHWRGHYRVSSKGPQKPMAVRWGTLGRARHPNL